MFDDLKPDNDNLKSNYKIGQYLVAISENNGKAFYTLVFDNKSLSELLYWLPKSCTIINITVLSNVRDYRKVMKEFQLKNKPNDLELGI